VKRFNYQRNVLASGANMTSHTLESSSITLKMSPIWNGCCIVGLHTAVTKLKQNMTKCIAGIMSGLGLNFVKYFH